MALSDIDSSRRVSVVNYRLEDYGFVPWILRLLGFERTDLPCSVSASVTGRGRVHITLEWPYGALQSTTLDELNAASSGTLPTTWQS